MPQHPPDPKIILPPSRPQIYLAWMAFLVLTEQAVRADRRLRGRAVAMGLLQERSLRNVHRVLCSPVTRQCEEALEQERTRVRPAIAGTGDDLASVVHHIEHFGSWLVQDGIAQTVGLALPSPEVAAVRSAALRAIRDHPAVTSLLR